MTPNDVSLKDYSYSNGSAPLPQLLPYADMLTIYPPGSQILFAIASMVSGGNESIWKLTFWILLVIPSMALWRISPPRVRPWLALAALSPIVLLHGFADSHVDAFMAVFMALALVMHQRGAITTSAILLGVAISIKYLPLVMIPVLLQGQCRRDVLRIITLTVGTVGLIYLPFIGENLVGSLGRFTQAWQTNSLIFTVLSWFVSVDLIRPIIGGMLLIASVYVIRRWRMQPLTVAALFMNIVMVLSPVVHPWYLLAPLALMPLVPLRSVITWTFTMCLYAVGYSTYKGSGVWLEHPAALVLEFIPAMVALVIDVRRGPLSLLDEHRA
jgi:predicted membrane-bound dolichyl-phosphate-mannose-protein mannosyltransferase